MRVYQHTSLLPHQISTLPYAIGSTLLPHFILFLLLHLRPPKSGAAPAMYHRREPGLPFSTTHAADKYSGDLPPCRLSKLFFTSLLVFSSFILTLCLLAARDNRLDFTRLQLQKFTRAVQRLPAPPGPAPTSLDHVLFGIGGSSSSWSDRRNYTELWWQPNRTRGYVWFDVLPGATASDGKLPTYKVSEDATRFPYTCWYGSRPAVRLSRIIVESVRLREEGVRWYVVGDDDTVFFADNLAAVLGQYDYRSMYYIGGVSESVEQNVMHSYNVALGGGGFAVSRPLAEALVPIFAGCLRRYDSFYGSDERVAACAAELGVPLTRHQGFHQLDIRGDAYGLLAAHPIAPLVSLHHLEYLPPIFPAAATKLDAVLSLFKASRVDAGRTLQQAIGYGRGWSVSVSWGYTVQIYPFAVPPVELEIAVQTFQTWRSRREEPFTFNTRAWSSDPCRRPVIYFLHHEVLVMKGMGTVSLYKVHGRGRDDVGVEGCNDKEYKEALKVKMVEVLAGKMGATAWTKVIWCSIYIFLTHFISYIRNYSPHGPTWIVDCA